MLFEWGVSWVLKTKDCADLKLWLFLWKAQIALWLLKHEMANI